MQDFDKRLSNINDNLEKLIALFSDGSFQKVQELKNDWIDGQDVMQILHISQRTLQTIRENGTLPFSKVNGKIYYKTSDIESILTDNYSKK